MITLFASAFAGGGVKWWTGRKSVTPEQCDRRHAEEQKRNERLEQKINSQTRMIRSLITHTISDPGKQEEILNENGGSG